MATVAGVELAVLFQALDAELQRTGTATTEVCVIGGSALAAIGLVTRPTKDVDIVALARHEGEQLVLHTARPLPGPLSSAVAAVASQYLIDSNWLNAGPADLIDHGLPEGFEGRLITNRIGHALTVHFAARLDQICFKTYAAADVAGRHLTDLLALRPSDDEMAIALRWIADQDDSEGFRQQLTELLDYMGMTHVARGR